ncbi:hypothetical protein N9N21_05785 [Alphaproteobacteria bacterium]|nr:hypothetical protein [Alphaproteobacteria bacterium]
MANPSLKAQIEAAKSALASDLAAPSLVTPPPKPPMTPTTPIMARNDIATDAGSLGADATDAGANPISADCKSAHAKNAAALDERITRLEAKLLDNQRDLHTLLQKIREISRLQTNSGKSRKNQATDKAETKASDEARNKAEPRQSQRSPVVMVAMAILIGLVVGIAYFLVTAEGDLSGLIMPSWVPTIIDHFNGWIG